MPEVKVKEGEELNGLGFVLKDLMDRNLANPKKYKAVKNMKGRVVIKESGTGVAITLSFREGEIEIQNGAVDKPSAYMEASFDNLAGISSGQIGPPRALLTGKAKVRGNLFKLLKILKTLVPEE